VTRVSSLPAIVCRC